MPSTAAKGKVSRIVPFLSEGAAVTTSRNDVNYIVTEYGIANLRGKTLRQRADFLFEKKIIKHFVQCHVFVCSPAGWRPNDKYAENPL